MLLNQITSFNLFDFMNLQKLLSYIDTTSPRCYELSLT